MTRTSIATSGLMLAFACSPSAEADDSSPVVGPDAAPSEDNIAPQPEAAAIEPRPFVRDRSPLFERLGESVTVTDTVWVQAEPFADGARLGMIRGGAATTYESHVVNQDCATPWIEIPPRGFACVSVAPTVAKKQKSKKGKKKRKRHIKRRRPMIGSYAIAAKGARFYRSLEAARDDGRSRPARGDMVRRSKTVELDDGRQFWRTQRGEYVEATFIRRLWGSKFRGVSLTADDAPALPFAFAVDRRRRRARIAVRAAPDSRARVVARLKARSVVAVGATSDDGEFVTIGDDRWVARADLRIVEVQEPPPEATGRWADVDLPQQLVVVYDGVRPIFATLASTGRDSDPTPTGTFAVTRKKIRTTMASDRSKRQSYSVAVPWATYFDEGYAFHSAYWHDSFGFARSHGCVNLSPDDALTVYELLGPELPANWTVVYGHSSSPGSVVRVR